MGYTPACTVEILSNDRSSRLLPYSAPSFLYLICFLHLLYLHT